MASSEDIAAFKLAFPEFRPAPDSTVGSRLDDAESQLGGIWTGEQRARGKRYLAAHLLSLAPNAKEMALVSEDGSSIYEREFKRVQRSVTAGRRVLVFGG